MSAPSPSRAAIIVAGGSGKRMGGEVPKQFQVIAGMPVLMHTLIAFNRFDSRMRLVLVLPETQFGLWEELKTKFSFDLEHDVVAGGSERFFSVKQGLSALKGEAVVGIHDGVRPLVSSQTLLNAFRAAGDLGAAVPVIAVDDTLRHKSGEESTWVNRAEYVRVQTPQCFRAEIILKAYQQEFSLDFTDDASVAERAGFKISLVEGNRENIKITTPFDRSVAEMLLKQ